MTVLVKATYCIHFYVFEAVPVNIFTQTVVVKLEHTEICVLEDKISTLYEKVKVDSGFCQFYFVELVF